ncbi:hypothetical protein [Bradyrhizobium sp. 76]|uniref:hypothetical protein n=1 Tax=Bradyrhizobium sp. 76 TaxID=2782680 RepID=UPI001FF7DC64|nr:hypothetical protein [Bradyrhizobium sp. 76]MCK1409525.1 hypothetical protein [Bradyrhizobium sp. 76]
MASKASIFFAGVGTTFLILGAGFGSGLLMANSALKDPNSYVGAKEEVPAAIRVVLPSSAEAAEPRMIARPEQHAATPQIQLPAKEPQPAPDNAEKSDSKKADADKRRKRVAERKAKRLAARPNHRSQEAPVMASGGDEARPAGTSFNLFTN